MAKISVNDQYLINGRVSIRRYKKEDGGISVEGSFATHYYFEEINSLESYRYLLTNIEVVEEVFGTDDFDIVYNFVADNIEIKSDMSDLSTEEIIEIEKNIYGKSGYVLETLLDKGAESDE